jgi:hypothetical protein
MDRVWRYSTLPEEHEVTEWAARIQINKSWAAVTGWLGTLAAVVVLVWILH